MYHRPVEDQMPIENANHINCLRAGLAPNPSFVINNYIVGFNLIYDRLINHIQSREKNDRVIVISHEFGAGKTTFLNFIIYKELFDNNNSVSYIQFGKNLKCTKLEILYQELIKGLHYRNRDTTICSSAIFTNRLKMYLKKVGIEQILQRQITTRTKFFLILYNLLNIESDKLQTNSSILDASDIIVGSWITTRWLTGYGYDLKKKHLEHLKQIYEKLKKPYDLPEILKTESELNTTFSKDDIKDLLILLSDLLTDKNKPMLIIIDEFEGITKEAGTPRKYTIKVLETINRFFSIIEAVNPKLFLIIASTPAFDQYINSIEFERDAFITYLDRNMFRNYSTNRQNQIIQAAYTDNCYVYFKNPNDINKIESVKDFIQQFRQKYRRFVNIWDIVRGNNTVFDQLLKDNEKTEALLKNTIESYSIAYQNVFSFGALLNAVLTESKYHDRDAFNAGLIDTYSADNNDIIQKRYFIKYVLKLLDLLCFETKRYVLSEYNNEYSNTSIYSRLKLVLMLFSKIKIADSTSSLQNQTFTIRDLITDRMYSFAQYVSCGIINNGNFYSTIQRNSTLYSTMAYFSLIEHLYFLNFADTDILWGLRFHANIPTLYGRSITGLYTVYSNNTLVVNDLIIATGFLYQIIRNMSTYSYLISEVDLSRLKEKYGVTLASFRALVLAIIDNVIEITSINTEIKSSNAITEKDNPINVISKTYQNDPSEFIYSLFKAFYSKNNTLFDAFRYCETTEEIRRVLFNLEETDAVLRELRTYCSYSFDFFKAFNMYAIKRLSSEKRDSARTEDDSKIDEGVNWNIIVKKCFNNFLLRRSGRSRNETIAKRREVEKILKVPIVGNFTSKEAEEFIKFIDKMLSVSGKKLIVVIKNLHNICITDFTYRSGNGVVVAKRQNPKMRDALDNLRRLIDLIGSQLKNIVFLIAENDKTKTLLKDVVKDKYEALYQRLTDIEIGNTIKKTLKLFDVNIKNWEFTRYFKPDLTPHNTDSFIDNLSVIISDIRSICGASEIDIKHYLKLIFYSSLITNLKYLRVENSTNSSSLDSNSNNSLLERIDLNDAIELQQLLWGSLNTIVENNVNYSGGALVFKDRITINDKIKTTIIETCNSLLRQLENIVSANDVLNIKPSQSKDTIMNYIKEVLITNDSGINFFNYQKNIKDTDNTLKSALWIAINSFFKETYNASIEKVYIKGHEFDIINKTIDDNTNIQLAYLLEPVSNKKFKIIHEKMEQFLSFVIDKHKDKLKKDYSKALTEKERNELVKYLNSMEM